MAIGKVLTVKVDTLDGLVAKACLSRFMDRFHEPVRFLRSLSHIHEACRVSKTMVSEREGERVSCKKVRVDCAANAMGGGLGARHSMDYLTITFSDLAQTEGRLS